MPLEEDEKKLVICGGGHIAVAVIRIARILRFNVTVLEDRREYAENAEKAGAQEVICAAFEDGLKKIAGDEDTFFVIVTREHALDIQCLNSVSRKPHAYIGMIGSKKRAALVREYMVRELDCDPGIINEVQMPVGVDINSETPEEIAVSIMAQIIQFKNRERRNRGCPREILDILCDPLRDEPIALATVTKRSGSVPRDTGARMIIRQNGDTVGTIGGGLLEAGVIHEAEKLLQSGGQASQVYEADLNTDTDFLQGMACGGKVSVLIETIEPGWNPDNQSC